MKEEQNKELIESINKYTKLAPLSFRGDILTPGQNGEAPIAKANKTRLPVKSSYLLDNPSSFLFVGIFWITPGRGKFIEDEAY